MELGMKRSGCPCIFTINKVNVQRLSSLQVAEIRAGRVRPGPGNSRVADSTSGLEPTTGAEEASLS